MTVMSSTKSGHDCSMTNPKLSSNELILLAYPCDNGLVNIPWNDAWTLTNGSTVILLSKTRSNVSQA